jgi:peptide chain release factor subunit 1
MFDPRLAAKVVVTLDVCYGFENGLNQAIELAQESLQNVKFVKEKELISSFFEEINMDSGLVVYGIKDTMKLLETGSIRKIVCNEGKFFANVAL